MVVGAKERPDTATPGPLYENGIRSAPAVPTNHRAQLRTANTSTCVFMRSLSAGGEKA